MTMMVQIEFYTQKFTNNIWKITPEEQHNLPVSGLVRKDQSSQSNELGQAYQEAWPIMAENDDDVIAVERRYSPNQQQQRTGDVESI